MYVREMAVNAKAQYLLDLTPYNDDICNFDRMMIVSNYLYRVDFRFLERNILVWGILNFKITSTYLQFGSFCEIGTHIRSLKKSHFANLLYIITIYMIDRSV